MKPKYDMARADSDIYFSDTVRNAPVIMALDSGGYDSLMARGSSFRVRDSKSGYFRFVINDGEDIGPLTEDIHDMLRYAICVDDEYEYEWHRLFPDARRSHYRLCVATPDLFRPSPDYELPAGAQFVEIDKLWQESIIEMWANKEFTADSFKQQFSENLSMGLLLDGKRAGYFSEHLNGELGPLWVSPEHQGRNLGTVIMQGYLREYFKKKSLALALLAPDNSAVIKSVTNLGFEIPKRDVLHIAFI